MLMQRIISAPAAAANAAASSGSVAGLNATAIERPCARAAAPTPAGSSVASTWKVTESAPDSANSGKWCSRVADHQVAVDDAAGRVDHRRDRAEDDGPDRHRWHEVAVADIEVEDPAAGAEECVDLLTEAREVGGVQRRLDLAPLPDPALPAHGAILRAPPTASARDLC